MSPVQITSAFTMQEAVLEPSHPQTHAAEHTQESSTGFGSTHGSVQEDVNAAFTDSSTPARFSSVEEQPVDSGPVSSGSGGRGSTPSSRERGRDEEGLRSQLAGLRRRAVLRAQG